MISVTNGEHTWPFSKGLVVESLMNADIGREPAVVIARRVEQRLLDEDKRIIAPDTLKQMISDEARNILGVAVAERLSTQTAAFEDVVVQGENSNLPFSKGILARSLEQSGLALDDAFDFAKEFERRLRVEGVRKIDEAELEARVMQEIFGHFGHSIAEAYLERQRRAAQVNVTEDDGTMAFPYSKGILAQSILATGLAPDSAHQLSRDIELELWDSNQRSVTRTALRQMVESLLREDHGEILARRYRSLHSLKRSSKPLHILLGGVAGTGKSLLATEIAYRLGIPRIESTDSIRQVMRAMISRELLPSLHASSFEAWLARLEPHEASSRRKRNPSRELLLEGFRDQVSQVTVGLRAIIERGSSERTPMVIEGVHIVPGFLPVDAFEDVQVIPMVVVLRNEEEHRKRFYLRDQQTRQHRPMQHYLDHFDEIRMLQNYVEQMARTVGVPVIDAESLDHAAEQAIEVITNKVLGVREEITTNN